MFLIGLTITAVGFILALAVHPENPGSVNVNTIGWILVAVGIVAFLADLLLWSSRGPGYGGYAPRRRVIEEEQTGPPPGPGY